MWELIITIGVPIALIVLAMVTGTLLEKRHFQDIRQREATLSRMPLLVGKAYPLDTEVAEARLVHGSVVVSVDYFKRFLAGLRNIFGGEVRAYCSLLDRGRREALLRMQEQWTQADLIVNVRVETSSISKGGKSGRRGTIGSTELLAYGTAIRFAGPKAHEDRP
jgi:uncharacterized protein YbjQ (UPF0145 family)